ncbi:MAG TPA: carbohydrate kinase family protein [Clostridia bacterium]|nr:carbohydrate kinase family protein [Clostridia bacterium]HPK16961.1 carbohydrate kinase family protein [Clostridia bacterium]
MEKKRLLVVGQINIDTLIFDGNKTKITPGGAGTYVAMSASTYEDIETDLLATICSDMPDSFLQDMRRNNINTENILPLLGHQRRSRLEYSTEFLRNNTGMLTDQWKFLTAEQTPRHYPLRNVRYDALHLPPQPSFNQRLYAQWGCESNMLVSLDTCERYAQSNAAELLETLPYVNVFMPSEIELYSMFPTCNADLDLIAQNVRRLGVKLLVVKRAENGSQIYDFECGKVYELGIRRVDALDATGAGDSYNGGFLACYLATGDVELSAKYGACAASICIGELGYQALCKKTKRDILPLLAQVPCRVSDYRTI